MDILAKLGDVDEVPKLLTARVSLEVGFSAAALERPTLNPKPPEGGVVSLPWR